MISRNILIILCCLLICLLNFDKRVVVAQGPLVFDCVDSSTYNPSTTAGKYYQTNLNFLLSTLSSNASRATTNGFYNFTAGNGNDPSSTVYGLFLCQGDKNTDDCARCVETASKTVVEYCGNQKTAIIWYEYCMLRYSNESTFSRVDPNIKYHISTQGAGDTKSFDPDMMQRIASQAANHSSGPKFASEASGFSSASAQCTPDLSSDDCENCLRNAIDDLPSCCSNSQRAIVLFPSCRIMYDLNRIYNPVTPTPPPPPPPPPPTPPPPPPPPPAPPSNRDKSRLSVQVTIGIVISTTLSLTFLVTIFVFLKKRSRRRDDAYMQETIDQVRILNIDPESLKYSLSEIQIATNNFSVNKKIGEGGFGPVYKGTLPNGQDIAVKRLSTRSGQGVEEFKNEILVVAKLRHNNLIRLLGFCLHGVEKTLVYEFAPNKSLDYFLFDPEKQQLLDWSKRYKIIEGIARGLLYLHQDSPLRVVHRDLKASNILLDENMNAKIADFGMAKICGVDQFEGNTNRIAGTFGYMAPEYTRSGQFSVKSDVFSFGVVMLEIITGKKNSNFYKSEDSQDLLSYAWQQWREGTPLALLDPTIVDSYVKFEVLRCIHVSLLCVEEDAARRPRMASVVYMLDSNSVSLPTPHLPAVSRNNKSESILEERESQRSNAKLMSASVNNASITELYPR